MSWAQLIGDLLKKDLNQEQQTSFKILESKQLDCLGVVDLLHYCKAFAFVSELLHTQRPVKVSQKMCFDVGEHETDSYWTHLMFWCGRLGRLMIEEITEKLQLTTKLVSPALSNAQFADSSLCDLIFLTHEVIGLLYYCDTRALSVSLFVADLIPDCIDTVHETHRLLSILNAFNQSRLQLNHGQWSKAAKAISLTKTLVETLELKRFKIIDALTKDLAVQTWVVRAYLYLSEDNKVVDAGDCFEEAKKLGYILNASAQDVIDERDLIAVEEVDLQLLVQNKELPSVQTDIILRGKSPLESYREIKFF